MRCWHLLELLATWGIGAGQAQAQRPDVQFVSPQGWVTIAPAHTETEWSCANWARDAWAVSLAARDSGIVIQPAKPEPDVLTVLVPGGTLSGFNSGEFGGELRYRNAETGRTDTIFTGNPIAILHTRHGLLLIAGLAHMGGDAGALYRLREDRRGHWVADSLMDLGTATGGVLLLTPDSLLLATTTGVRVVDIAKLRQREIFRNPEWYQLYSNSIVRDQSGTIYVGMRRAVARLQPIGGRFVETWLVPAQCQTLLPPPGADPYHCTCRPGKSG